MVSSRAAADPELPRLVRALLLAAATDPSAPLEAVLEAVRIDEHPEPPPDDGSTEC